MGETTADVRRDIEMTRERMSTTLAQLEQKVNVVQIVKDHPWPALAIAVGAGVLLSGSRADMKAAAATVSATQGASSKIGTVLDDVVANLMSGVSQAFQARVDGFVDEIKDALGAPQSSSQRGSSSARSNRATADSWNPSAGDGKGDGLIGNTPLSGGANEAMLNADRGRDQSGSREWQGNRAD
jgi:hypothetical protein